MTGDPVGIALAVAGAFGLGVTLALSWHKHRQIGEREAADKAKRTRVVAKLWALAESAGALATELEDPTRKK